MKLTKFDRQAFVRAVMADIPKEDFLDQMRKVVMDDSIEQLPAQLRQFALDPKTAPYLKTGTYWSKKSFTYFGDNQHHWTPSPKAQKKIDALREKHDAQELRLDEVRSKVSASIEACTTLKMAKERLPEFEKYLPQDRGPQKSAYLPAVANLVADLTKLGWPKDTKVAAQAA